MADPEDGCEVLKDPQVEEEWIALIIRSQKDHSSCSFDTKVPLTAARLPKHSLLIFFCKSPQSSVSLKVNCFQDQAWYTDYPAKAQEAAICPDLQLQSQNLVLQVRNAESAGAAAAIVYDNIYEALIIMAKPLGNPDPLIPAVFVSQKAGTVMHKMVLAGKTYAEILPVACQETFRNHTFVNFLEEYAVHTCTASSRDCLVSNLE